MHMDDESAMVRSRREWMGVEPTAACSAQPATGFEDQGIHQDTTTPRMRKL